MVFSINSGAVGILPPDNPVALAFATVEETGETLLTVPAGRTFYCTSLSLVNVNAVGGTDIVFTITVGGTTMFIAKVNAATSQAFAGNPLLLYATTGQAVVCTHTGTNQSQARLNIQGYYQ